MEREEIIKKRRIVYMEGLRDKIAVGMKEAKTNDHYLKVNELISEYLRVRRIVQDSDNINYSFDADSNWAGYGLIRGE